MQITRVSVNVSRKVSLPEYSNASFALALDADLEAGENAIAVADALRDAAAAYVEEQCNQALEAEGKPAKFNLGTLYDVVTFLDNVFMTVSGLVRDARLPLCRILHSQHRGTAAVRLAQQEAVRRGMHSAIETALLNEEEARATLVELAEASEALALFYVGRVAESYQYATIPLARVLFDEAHKEFYDDYRAFRDHAQVEDHLAHDWRGSTLVDVQTVEELVAHSEVPL
ncbi:MAG: hypothetical protein M0R37_11865 [Bacteroidales bacterium]|nr:hypothetical protein [Bacteroidales bacterium]